MKTEIHIVPYQATAVRLQEYGVGIFEECKTKSALKKALKKKYIKVNDAPAGTATYIKGGESIELAVPEKKAPKKKLIFPLEVLFEDEHLAIIHKPAGIVVSGNSFKTIANALPQNLTKSSLSDATRPQPVHRLDYQTTGILLVGKTSSSIRILNKMFENREIRKKYYAVTIQEMKPAGQITAAIDGRESCTFYGRRQSVPSERFGKLNLVQLNPLTGRRHQLRKHLAGMGNPILGDKEYGMEHLVLKGKGLYLHAASLEFIHPFKNEKIYLQDCLPKKFLKLFPALN